MATEQEETRAREALGAALDALKRGETVPVSARAFHMSRSELWEVAHQIRVETCPGAAVAWRDGTLTFKIETSIASYS